jgi:RNA polymerase sigma factor for flagellar operon FliA
VLENQQHPFLGHLPRIERIIGTLARLNRMSSDEAEDFASHVRLKLLEDDGAILRRFQGRSSLATYLTTVVTRLFLDYRREKWGRWRPSAVAKRLGREALLLERLLYRDGISFDEAAEMLRRNHGVALSVHELAELAGRLPPRTGRPVEQPDEDLERFGVEPRVAEPAEDAERAAMAGRVEGALREVLDGLDTTDRFLVRSLTNGLQVSEIARMLGEEQKPLYRRRDRLLRDLREQLEARGLTAGDVAEILEWGQADLDLGLESIAVPEEDSP